MELQTSAQRTDRAGEKLRTTCRGSSPAGLRCADPQRGGPCPGGGGGPTPVLLLQVCPVSLMAHDAVVKIVVEASPHHSSSRFVQKTGSSLRRSLL